MSERKTLRVLQLADELESVAQELGNNDDLVIPSATITDLLSAARAVRLCALCIDGKTVAYYKGQPLEAAAETLFAYQALYRVLETGPDIISLKALSAHTDGVLDTVDDIDAAIDALSDVYAVREMGDIQQRAKCDEWGIRMSLGETSAKKFIDLYREGYRIARKQHLNSQGA